MTYDDWKQNPPELDHPESELCTCAHCEHEGYLDYFVICQECGEMVCPDCVENL